MKNIPSGEVFGRAKVDPGSAPKHTAVDHELCAYYPNLSLNTMSCPHGEYSDGAFYSEDMVNALRRAAHRLLADLDSMAVIPQKKITERSEMEPPIVGDAAQYLGPLSSNGVRYLKELAEEFRRLTV